MGETKEDVEAALTSGLKPSHLEVIDTSGGCGASFAVEIVSPEFEGKRLLERHRMVNAAIGEEMMKRIHALAIKKAATPAQWSTTITAPPPSRLHSSRAAKVRAAKELCHHHHNKSMYGLSVWKDGINARELQLVGLLSCTTLQISMKSFE